MSPAVRGITLKVDVDTLRGTREGVPRLASLFARLQIPATFLFSVGPDHTGRALRRVFRRGFLSKVRRTSVASNYGLSTLLYGTLLPGPDIGRLCRAEMRSVADARLRSRSARLRPCEVAGRRGEGVVDMDL